MPYIATKPYRNGSDYVLKIIEGRQKEGQKVGDVVRGSQSTYQPALDNPLRFTGKVYVLIGPYTYSSAILFLERCPGLRGCHRRWDGRRGACHAKRRHAEREAEPHADRPGRPAVSAERPSGAEGSGAAGILIPDDPFRAATAIEALLRL